MGINRFGFILAGMLAACSLNPALGVEEPINIDEQATHEQVGLIEIPEADKVNAFCLDAQGQILTAIGAGPGEIRVLSPAGKKTAAWTVEIKPEAINTAPDGTILVAGDGKVMRFSPEGKLLAEAESPHATAVKEHQDEIRAEAEKQLTQQSRPAAAMIEAYTQMMEQLQAKEEKGELNEQEKQVLKVLPEHIARYEEMKAAEDAKPKDAGPADDQITERMNALMQRKLHVASVSSDGKHVYVAAPSIKGYTFDVWRTNNDFTDAQVVVTDLRGCCGHMDVQACAEGLYVAENARHRVACFNAAGEAGVTWGKADRTGKDGFTSCCNPMNVCFNKAGDVYTAESNTGRIKRFAADGTFKEYVGDVKLVPGCKNVSIAVSPDSDRVYMLDITRNHIVLMQRKSADAKPAETTESNETAAETSS